MRIMVTGCRDWTDKGTIRDAFKSESLWGSFTVLHGGAEGADSLAAEQAESMGWNVEVYPANWKKHGKAAGPIRNQEMVDSGPDYVMAFWDGHSPGTKDAITKAVQAGIRVNIYPPKKPSNG